MDLSEKSTTYKICLHNHHEIENSWRHMNQENNLRCLVCIKMKRCDLKTKEDIHMHLIAPYHQNPEKYKQKFHEWLFSD